MSQTIRSVPSRPAELRKESSPTASLYEGVSIKLHPAPFVKRFLAFSVDVGIVSTANYLLLIAASLGAVSLAGLMKYVAKISRMGAAAAGVGMLLGVILVTLLILATFDTYFVYFELKTGTTPGKRLFGLRVVSLRGGRLTLGQCIMRAAFRWVDCFLLFPGPLSIALTAKAQRLGDLAASTLVTYSQQKEEEKNFLYVTQQDYYHFWEALTPAPVPDEVCRRFLQFAYPALILKERHPAPEELHGWEQRARHYLPGAANVDIDQETCLHFFAEYCSRTLNHTVQTKLLKNPN